MCVEECPLMAVVVAARLLKSEQQAIDIKQ